VQELAKLPQFAHLRPGYAWHDPATTLLTIALAPQPCDDVGTGADSSAAPVDTAVDAAPTWRYTVPDFYGYHGEAPFYPRFERSDYSGLRHLECLPMLFATQAPAPGHLGTRWLRLLASSGVGRVAQRAELAIDVSAARDSDISGASDDPIVAAVWRDNANVTFSTNATEAALPLPRRLRQTAAAAAAECAYMCWDAVSVKVALRSGAHGLANIRVLQSSVIAGYTVSVEYISYTLGSIRRASEALHADPPPVSQLKGESAFGQREGQTRVRLRDLPAGSAAVGATVATGGELRQWSVSIKLLVRCLASAVGRSGACAQQHSLASFACAPGCALELCIVMLTSDGPLRRQTSTTPPPSTPPSSPAPSPSAAAQSPRSRR
jgi:hypothetical protein